MSRDGGAALASRVGHGLGWSTVSNLAMRVANFLVSILMARLIAPEQFGVFAVALTVWSILGTLAEFGLGTDLVRARDVEHRIPTVATMGLLTSGLLALAMAAAAVPLAHAFESPDSAGVIRLMSVTLVLFGFQIVPSALLQREFRQRALFAVNGSGILASAVVMTTLALQGVGPASLAWGQVTAQAVIVVGMFAAARVRFRLGFDRTVAWQSATFCLPLALANLLSWALLSIDNLVVARVMSPVDLGLYVLAFNISSWPMSAIGQAIRVVALPAFARVDGVAARSRALVATAPPVAAVGALMGLTLSTLATPLVVLLYGARWRDAGAALAGLAVFGAARVGLDLLATFLIAIGASRSVLLVQVWWLLAMVPAMLVGVRWFGLAGAGWTHVVVALLVVLPAYLVCLGRHGVDWAGFLRGCVLPVLAALPAAAVCAWAVPMLASPFAALLLGGTVVCALYAAPLAPWFRRRLGELTDQAPALETTDALR